MQHQVCKLLTAESPTPGLLLFVCGFRSLRTTDALPQGQPADLLPLPSLPLVGLPNADTPPLAMPAASAPLLPFRVPRALVPLPAPQCSGGGPLNRVQMEVQESPTKSRSQNSSSGCQCTNTRQSTPDDALLMVTPTAQGDFESCCTGG